LNCANDMHVQVEYITTHIHAVGLFVGIRNRDHPPDPEDPQDPEPPPLPPDDEPLQLSTPLPEPPPPPPPRRSNSVGRAKAERARAKMERTVAPFMIGND
jgi:hypothetical protein